MINRYLFILIIAIALFSSLKANAQFSMPDNTIVGAEKQYWVDSIAGSGSTYVWKIDHVIQQNGPVNSFTITWNSIGTFFLEVQETSADNCQGEIMSGWVNVTVAPVLEIICPEVEVLCAVETVPAYTNLNSFLNAGGTIVDNCGLDTASFNLSFEEISGSGYPESYSITRTYTISNICGITAQCLQVISVPGELSVINTSVTNVTVFGGNTGSFTVSGWSGSAPYQYQLDSGEYQTSGTFNSLTAGNYVVTVRDNNLCIFEVPFTITQPSTNLDGMISTQENVLCFGENNGSVTVSGLFGTGPYEYKIGNGNYQSSGTFNSLPAGNYTVTVRDAMLSTFQIQITITQNEALTVSTTHTNVLCFGDGTGSATVNANGGTEPYYYFWENLPGLLPSETDKYSPATFLNLYAGTYTVKVTDDNGCSIETTVTIESENTYPDADFTTEFSEFMTYSFQVNSTNAATTYLWDFGDGQTSVSVNPENTYAETGTYTITLTASNICGTVTTTQQVTVTVPDLEIYNGFSPNDDGINDYWIVPILDYYPVNIVKIINRWGSEVWMGTNYNNTNNLWSGKNLNGVDLPDGTYYYVISYSDIKKRGWVFIKR